MAVIITWVAVGIFVLFLGIGALAGLVRGWKRASLHFLFLLISLLLAFFITRPVSNAILGIDIFVDETGTYTIQSYLIKLISSNFDISSFKNAYIFIEALPAAIISPIIFILLALFSYLIFDIIYLIVSRIALGKKKVEFRNKRPYRGYGALIGAAEGFLFLVFLFAPLTALTDTYAHLSYLPEAQVVALSEEDDGHIQTIPQLIQENVPDAVNEIVIALNESVIGKVSNFSGLHTAMFDGLSSVRIDGENIKLRQEIVNLAKTFDSFVGVYNKITDGKYSQIDMTEFKINLERILDSGMFRAVITDSIKSFVVNYKEILADSIDDLPEIAIDIFDTLKARFEEERFDINAYIKADIMDVVGAVEKVFKSGIIEAYQALDDQDFIEILKIIGEEEKVEPLTEVISDIFELNIVNDTLKPLLNYASDMIGDLFPEKEGKENLVIKLNSNITNTKGFVEGVVAVLKNFLELNAKLDFSSLMNGEGGEILDSFISNENLEEGLEIAGYALDDIRELEIFVLPAENGGQPTYVFDNILAYYDFNVLGDTVYSYNKKANGDVEITSEKLDSYSKFFGHIKTAVLNAKDFGLLESSDLKSVLTGLIEKLEKNPGFLADTLLTFKGLTALDLGNLVFTQVTDLLNDSGVMSVKYLEDLDASAVTEDEKKASFQKWWEEFENLGKIIVNLNGGDINGQSYIEYLLDGEADYNELIDVLAEDNDFVTIFGPIFKSQMFRPLNEQLLDTIDQTIGDLTGLYTKSDIEKIGSDGTAKAIQDLLKSIKDVSDLEKLQFESIGEIMEVLRKNAASDGVFDVTFANLIWYMTGDTILSVTEEDVIGLYAHEQHEKIKQYLDPDDLKDYINTDFITKFKTIDTALAMGEQIGDLFENFKDGITGDNAAEFADALKDNLKEFLDDENVNVSDILDNVDMFVDENSGGVKGLIPSEEEDPTGETRQAIEDAIDEAFSDDQEVADALKKLLGL